jgi:AcrR family transcriptional regulator
MAKKKSIPKSDTYHHGDLRTTLLETAIKMLATRSPSELSLRELAREAGVSGAAPYRHFKDKNELLAAISQQGFEMKFSYMIKAMKEAKGDPEKMFFGCGLAYFKMGKDHPQHFKLMMSSEVIPCETYPELMKIASTTFVLVREMVSRCQEKGLIGKGDPYLKAMNCWSVLNGFTSLYADGGLEWLGVTKGNAEKALQTLMSQFLIGSSKSLEQSNYGFQLFSTPDSKEDFELLKQIEPEIKKILEN